MSKLKTVEQIYLEMRYTKSGPIHPEDKKFMLEKAVEECLNSIVAHINSE